MIEHIKFSKIARLNRDCVITEKIDGSNAVIYIGEDEEFLTGSRNRWITPENDNMGFSSWANENKEELLKLGQGYHYGEWIGQGIQRNYGLKEKRFYLFNVGKWVDKRESPELKENDKRQYCPDCCYVVPILYTGFFDTNKIQKVLENLKINGSVAVNGFNKPEGIIIFHTHSRTLFKVTCENDEKPKSLK